MKPFLIEPATHEEALAKLLEATQILKRLRAASSNWQLHFGSYYKNEMLRWQQKADDFLNENIVELENYQPQIKID